MTSKIVHTVVSIGICLFQKGQNKNNKKIYSKCELTKDEIIFQVIESPVNPPTGKTARSIRRKKELIQSYRFQKGPSNTKQQQSTSISFSTIFHLRASSHYSATIFYCFSPSVLARVALEFFSQNSSLPYLAFHLKIPPNASSIFVYLI